MNPSRFLRAEPEPTLLLHRVSVIGSVMMVHIKKLQAVSFKLQVPRLKGLAA